MPLTQEQEEHVRLWVEALRSKEFQQARESLCNGVGHCCLGVGAEVFRRLTGRGQWKGVRGEDGEMSFEVDGHTSTTFLPPPVAEFYGLRTTRGTLRDAIPVTADHDDEWAAKTLYDLNDEGRWDFNRIADLIESHPPGLFID